MSLIKCPECGNEISSLARSCPNCGCPINENESSDVLEKEVGKPSKTKIKRKDWIYCGVMVFVALLVIGVCLPLQDGRNKRVAQHKIAALNQKQEEDKARFEAEEKIRKEAEEKARKEEEERNRPKEIHLRYSITYGKDEDEDVIKVNSGTFHVYAPYYGPGNRDITTDNITVPLGKTWTLKNIKTLNMRGVKIIYMESQEGNRYKYCEDVNVHATILHGGETFRIGFDTYSSVRDYVLDLYFLETNE